RVGLRVKTEEDLDRAAAHFAAVGRCEARLEGSEQPRGQGPTVTVRDPFGVPLSLYHRQDLVERQLQSYDRYHGATVQRLDHVNGYAADLQATHDYYTGELGFRVR